jgi:branched-chain amino acid aminotransferase
MSLVWLNGRLLPSSEPGIRADDRGFLLGDGLFETMRVRNGTAFRLDAHLRRLREGATRLRIPVPGGIEAGIEALLSSVPTAGHPADREPDVQGNAALRLTLTRGPGEGGLEPPREPAPTLAISIREMPSFDRAMYERGLSVAVSGNRVLSTSPTAGIKTIGYLPNILALIEARERGAGDAVVLNERGEVVESSASNLFWIDTDGVLCTPSQSCGILPGITRAVVLELARRSGLRVCEGEWSVEALGAAREVFATSSLRGIAPIRAVDEQLIGEGSVGQVTRSLRSGYEELVKQETSALSTF